MNSTTRGTLKYGGKSYPITVGGLGVGGFGASRLTASASGTVYGLARWEAFADAYLQVRTGWALGDQGKGTLWLRNDKGVTMRLNTRRQYSSILNKHKSRRPDPVLPISWRQRIG